MRKILWAIMAIMMAWGAMQCATSCGRQSQKSQGEGEEWLPAPAVRQGMYEEPSYWFNSNRPENAGWADVFYVLPTCVFDWSDAEGRICHYASLTDSIQRAQMQPSYELALQIFGDSANFFAPYYRHISLNTWMEGDTAVGQRFPQAMADVNEAFRHYLTHWNGGRPFVLAGFSQGGKCVVELVKTLDAETRQRLVAAYVCGYRVTAADTLAAPQLCPARGADDVGVTIVYNTVSDTSAIAPVLSEGNLFVINPVGWTTDTLAHALNDSVTLQLDAQRCVLMASGLDLDAAFVPSLSSIFPRGNLHLQELTLYQEALRQNVKQRIRNFQH